MKPVFLLAIQLLLLNPLIGQKTFFWKWQRANDTLQITGKLDEKEARTVHLSGASAKKDFAFLYRTVDELRYNQWPAYQKAVAALSQATVQPFEKDLAQCDRVVVEMDSSLLNLPVEFLHVRNEAMAVFRPMVFTINGYGRKQAPDTLTLHKGFILRDPSSDPEDACTTTFRLYPGSTFRSTYRLKPEDLRFKPAFDFALVSAHGFADSVSLRGCVFAKEEPVKPIVFQNTELKLVYIDGCQQGINWSYIKALSQSPRAGFYLGPIVSNDAGESSTKTINWFFARLKQRADPVVALWQTRKQLHQHYRRRIHGMDVVNKSFIFRIYRL